MERTTGRSSVISLLGKWMVIVDKHVQVLFIHCVSKKPDP